MRCEQRPACRGLGGRIISSTRASVPGRSFLFHRTPLSSKFVSVWLWVSANGLDQPCESPAPLGPSGGAKRRSLCGFGGKEKCHWRAARTAGWEAFPRRARPFEKNSILKSTNGSKAGKSQSLGGRFSSKTHQHVPPGAAPSPRDGSSVLLCTDGRWLTTCRCGDVVVLGRGLRGCVCVWWGLCYSPRIRRVSSVDPMQAVPVPSDVHLPRRCQYVVLRRGSKSLCGLPVGVHHGTAQQDRAVEKRATQGF